MNFLAALVLVAFAAFAAFPAATPAQTPASSPDLTSAFLSVVDHPVFQNLIERGSHCTCMQML